MYKYFFSIFTIIFVFSLIAENVTLESPMGTFKLSVDSSVEKSSSQPIVDAIAERVEELESKFLTKLNKLDQKRAEKITEEIYELLALLPEDLYISSNTTPPPPPPSQNESVDINFNVNETVSTNSFTEESIHEAKPANDAMSESDFMRLYNNVEEESFADDQLSVVKIAARSKYFTVNQLTRLVDLFSFSDEKIQCVQIIYPKVVDKENAHELIGAFTYSDDKRKVEKIINQ